MPCWASEMSGKYGTKKLFQTIPTGVACAHLASGNWHLASGIWHLAFDIWHLVTGNWHLVFDIWHLTSGISLRSHRTGQHCPPAQKILTMALGIWHLAFDFWHLASGMSLGSHRNYGIDKHITDRSFCSGDGGKVEFLGSLSFQK